MDESDKELIRVAREDLEDDEPKEKSHKEKKRSTEGKTELSSEFLPHKMFTQKPLTLPYSL